MAFFPFYSQYDPDDCGVMALRMVCAWHGKELEPGAIREACQVPFGELSFLSLNQGAESLGFNAISVRLQPHQWDQNLILPAIAHVFTQHFVVIMDITEKFVHLADPLRGVLRVDRGEFQKEWLFGEPLHLLILNQEANSGPHKLVVQTNETGHLTNWSFLTVSVLLLEALVLFLSLQWIGLSFLNGQQFTENRLVVIGISFLLLAAFVLILRQWSTILKDPESNPTNDEGTFPNPTLSHETSYYEWIRIFHQDRKASFSLLPRAIVLNILLLGYTIVQWGSYGLLTLGLVSLFLWVSWMYPSGPKANFVRNADLWLANLASEDIKPKEASGFKGAFRKWISSMPLWVLGSVWFIGLLALQLLVPLSLPEGFQILLVGAATIYYVYLSYVGIRAYQWRHYRPVDGSKPMVKDDLPLSGDIYLQLANHREILQEITFPFGKSTLLAGPFERDVVKIIETLKAHSLDEGTMITFGGKPVSKFNRSFYLEKIVVLSKEKIHFEEMDHIAFTFDSNTMNLPRIASTLMLPQDNIDAILKMPNPEDPALEVKRMIGRALILDPEWLLIDHFTATLEPFEEVILLENIIEYRKGRSTIIASNRAELIPTVDQVVYVNLKDKILVEQKEDIGST